jgi:hypothetical protein
MRRHSDVERNAFHEAGHAFVAESRGIRVRSVSVRPCGELGGLTCFRRWRSPAGCMPILVDRLRAFADVTLAGVAAEELWLRRIGAAAGAATWDELEARGEGDLVEARDACVRIARARRWRVTKEHEFLRAYGAAKALVFSAVGQRSLAAVARALLRSETIDGRTVRALLAEAHGA